ncbi:MAG: hypothetical protein WA071_06065 [Undibacterium umbellatum]|uniref:hypothetical protein n=1 Tax=Undibacterium umbellatum TaxID=2762300 RepID=UPI003BB4B859
MISGPFAQVLAAGRSQFNARVVEARRRYPAFDVQALTDFLQNSVAPVMQAVTAHMPDRLAVITLTAYDIALDLVGQALTGANARSKIVDRVWQDLLPAYIHILVNSPTEVFALLTNAALNIEKTSGARVEQWLGEMKNIAPQITNLPALHATGQVLAWRAGMTHFRDGVMAIADTLSSALLLQLLDADPGSDWQQIEKQTQQDPWWCPDSKLRNATEQGITVGQFTGFGGAFPAPPELRACEYGFWVKSADRYFLLMADVYGAVLHPSSKDEFEHGSVLPSSAATVGVSWQGNTLQTRRGKHPLNLPAKELLLTCNLHTVAVSSPYTYGISLYPL